MTKTPLLNNDSLRLLQGIVRRESRSLLQYVHESFPWITAGETDALARMRALAEEEQVAAVELAATLAKRHQRLPPYLGPYPMSFTSVNFVTLDYLVPLLIDYQKQGIADLERDLNRLSDEELAARVQKILDMKKRHLETLQFLAGQIKK